MRKSLCSAAFSLSSWRIFSISFFSSASSVRISLFSFTTAIGSTKIVWPDALWSWIMPGTWERYSDRTGRQ